MARLTDLPNELLEVIYRSLGSIDDVHHLARSCKVTSNAIKQDRVYVEVMRSVISQSTFHRFDLQLCYLLDLHRDVVKQLELSAKLLPQTRFDARGHISSLNIWEARLARCCLDPNHRLNQLSASRKLSDERIFQILTRWQGLRIFQDMWLSRELIKSDFLSFAYNDDANRLINKYNTLAERSEDCSDLPSRNSVNTSEYTNLDSGQRGRFHAALTAIWYLNEVRWMLAQFETVSLVCVPLKILNDGMEEFEKQTDITLLDQLDRLAMYQFLYQHILPVQLPSLANQPDKRLPLTYPSDLHKDSEYSAKFLQLCLYAGQVYIQPPDLIELVIRGKLQRKYPYPSPHPTDSTHKYMFPSRSVFPLRHNPSSLPNPTDTLRHSATILIDTILRASIDQSPSRPFRGTQQPDSNTLFCTPDLQERWLTRKCLHKFEVHGRTDRPDLANVWDKKWKTIRWRIWWWAGTEDKARMKLERCREDR